MGETMNREQAAAKLVAMMARDMSLHRSMSRSSAKDAAIGAVTDKAVDLILEVDRLKSELHDVTVTIQRHQPAGSPPGGGIALLAQWILSAKDAEAAELRASLRGAKDELRAIKGHDLPIEHGEDDYGLL